MPITRPMVVRDSVAALVFLVTLLPLFVLPAAPALGDPTAQFEWQREPVSVPDLLPPPWTPVRCQGNEAEVWGRRARLSPLGLPQELVSQGRTLLAAPAYLVLNGSPVRATGATSEWIAQSETSATLSGHLTFAGAAFSAETTVEFDGFARTRLTVTPNSATGLRDLTLVVPLLQARATYLDFNAIPGEWSLRPWHPGALRRFLVAGRWQTAFLPVLWLGDEDVGFAWCAESTEGWRTRGDASEMEVVSTARGAELRVHFVQPGDTGARTGDKTTVEFGWMATPAKPMPSGWRDRRFILDTSEQRQRRAGNVSILWHSQWAEALGSPRPRDGEAFRQLVEAGHRDGYKVLPYVALSDTMMSIASEPGSAQTAMGKAQKPVPEVAALAAEWSHSPCPRGWSEAPSAVHWGIPACLRSSWADFLLYYIAQDIRLYDIDGIYFDGAASIHCSEVAHGCGYQAPDGSRRVTNGLFAHREFLKRVYCLFAAAGKRPVIMVHSSLTCLVPSLSFVDAVLDGEQFNTHWRQPSVFEHLIPLDTWRAHYREVQSSVASVFLPSPEFWAPGDCREHLAHTLLHDTLLFKGWMDTGPLERVWAVKADFGLDKETGVTFVGYWDRRNRVSTSSPEVRVSYWTRRGESLVVVANLSRSDPGQVQVDLRGLGTVSTVTDGETGAALDCAGGRVTLAVGPKDFRLLRCLCVGAPADGSLPALPRVTEDPVDTAIPAAAYRDSSGRGNGIARSQFCRMAPGQTGTAVELLPGNGAALIVPWRPQLATPNGLTIAAWVWLDPAGNANDLQRVLTKEPGTDPIRNPLGVAPYDLSIGPQGDVWLQMTLGNAPIQLVTPTGVVPTGEWRHVAATYDGAVMIIYVNGRERARAPASGALAVTSGALILGNTDLAFRQQLSGCLDEIALWDCARSPEEIQADMATTPPAGTLGLVAQWRFDAD